jgi:hypothetical protein
LYVTENVWFEVVPQLLVWVTTAEHEAVGVKLCSREEPDVPQPLHAQLPPVTGSGLSVTWFPASTVTLAVSVRVPAIDTNALMGVALQIGVGVGVLADPPPPPPQPPSAR